jgi:hypothetical protein
MHIDLTTVISSGITAMIIGSFQVIGNRYIVRMLDHVEKRILGKEEKK